jgi:hypothetical protein
VTKPTDGRDRTDETRDERLQRRHRTRRDLLKTLVAGTGAAGALATLPESWTKPVIDSVLVPLHAQASPLFTVTGNVVLGDDAIGGLTGLAPGSYTTAREDGVDDAPVDEAGDDSTSVVLIATVTPPQAVEVFVDFSATGGAIDEQALIPASVMSDPVTGIASFGSFTANDLLDGDTDGDADGATITNITVTFSAAGAADSVISIDFT